MSWLISLPPVPILCTLSVLADELYGPSHEKTRLLVNLKSAKYRILGECLLISSLPGKALRTLVESLSSDSTYILEA